VVFGTIFITPCLSLIFSADTSGVSAAPEIHYEITERDERTEEQGSRIYPRASRFMTFSGFS
jgi:hypothetical protein